MNPEADARTRTPTPTAGRSPRAGPGPAGAPPPRPRGRLRPPRRNPGLCLWVNAPSSPWLGEVGRLLADWLARSREVECLTTDMAGLWDGSLGDPGLGDRPLVATFSRTVALLTDRGIPSVVACPLDGDGDRELARRGISRFVEVYLPALEGRVEREPIPAMVRRIDHGRLVEERWPIALEEWSARPELMIEATFDTPAKAAEGVSDALVRSGWLPG